MPQVGFEPMISAFERTKTIHALDRAATVIGKGYWRVWNNIKGSGHDLFEVLLRILSGVSGENYEKPQSRWSESEPRFEPKASLIWIWNVTATLSCPVALCRNNRTTPVLSAHRRFKYLKHNGNYMYHLLKNSAVCPHSVFMCSLWFSQ
jgi:hypothetical protein